MNNVVHAAAYAVGFTARHVARRPADDRLGGNSRSSPIMTNPVIDILNRTQAAMAPALAAYDRATALGATPPAIAELSRRVAERAGAEIDALYPKKDA